MAKYIDSKHSRGPKRWERAALNAMRKPNSAGARKYHTRIALAHSVTELAHEFAIDTALVPYAHMRRTTRYAYTASGHYKYLGKVDQRDYTTCSLFCAVMQMQLDFPGIHAVEDVTRVLNKTHHSTTGDWARWVETLNKETLHRTVRCQVCATEVKKK